MTSDISLMRDSIVDRQSNAKTINADAGHRFMIFPAKDQDYEEILSIWREANTQMLDGLSESSASFTKTFSRNFNQRNEIFDYWVLKTNDDDIVGFGSLIRASNNPFRADLCAEASIYVTSDKIGLGYGVRLSSHIVEWAKQSTLQFLTTYIEPTNRSSLRLAKKFGFHEVANISCFLAQFPHNRIFLVNDLEKSKVEPIGLP